MENTPLPVEDKIFKAKQEIQKIETRAKWLERIVWVLILGSIVVAAFGVYWMLKQQDHNLKWLEKLDYLGGFLSGTAGALLALAGVFFVYSGLLRQQQQLLVSLEEMQQTRKEVEGQTDALEKQIAQWELQRTEDSYFRMLESFKSIRVPTYGTSNSLSTESICNSMVYIKYSDNTKKEIIEQLEKYEKVPIHLGRNSCFIIKFLLRKLCDDREGLLKHFSAATSSTEKKLLFYYVLCFHDEVAEIRDWYLNSEMFSEADVPVYFKDWMVTGELLPFVAEEWVGIMIV